MGGKIPKERLDVLLVKRGLFESREKAKRHVMAGLVIVNGEVEYKPGKMVSVDSEISVKEPPRYVSRGGYKIESVWDELGLNVGGKTVCDIGASTGGFTDFLLQRGAKKVYAVDVGRGQLHWKLRKDDRVVVMEKKNARYLTEDDLGERVEFVTCDVSFISITKIIPAISRILREDGEALLLIKPQFEAPRDAVEKGVVRDFRVHVEVVENVLRTLRENGFVIRGLNFSKLKGPAGNIEYFVHVSKKGEDVFPSVEEIVSKAFRTLGGYG